MISFSEPINLKKFDAQVDQIQFDENIQWLQASRQEAAKRLRETGFPTTANEEWKYFSVKDLLTNDFSLVEESTSIAEEAEYKKLLSSNGINLVFINGVFCSKESNLSDVPGISIEPLQEAFHSHQDLIQFFFDKFPVDQDNEFAALNRVLFHHGLVLHVEANKVIEPTINIIHIQTNQKQPLIIPTRLFVKAEKSSEVKIIENFISFNDELRYFSCPTTDIYVCENATVNIVKAQKESLAATHIGSTRVIQEQNSNFSIFTLSAGSQKARNNLDISLEGEGISTTLNGLSSVFDKQIIDNHTFVDHKFPNCQSNQLYKAILNDGSRNIFNGKIFVKDIAQQTNSYQLNKNLLLGPDCRVDTKPQLEIFADDVKCTHGATIGQLDPEEIFYLQSRCIPHAIATKMLARGFIDDLLDEITDEELNDRLHFLLEPSFAKL